MINVRNTAARGPRALLDKRTAARAAEAMLRAVGPEEADLDITLVDDVAVAALNERFLRCAGPTNVISFEPRAEGDHGRVFLSLETAEREVFLYGQDPDEHVMRLLAHGILHTLGFDHGPEMDGATEACIDAGLSVLEETFLSAAEGPWTGWR